MRISALKDSYNITMNGTFISIKFRIKLLEHVTKTVYMNTTEKCADLPS